MADKVPMTPEGQARLREEIKRLKEVDLPQVVKDIGTAREHGDLSENAEYHAAKERQGMIVARITFLEQTFQIVGPEEADIKVQRISVASPLARGLLGHEVGDEVKVTMPAGPRTF